MNISLGVVALIITVLAHVAASSYYYGKLTKEVSDNSIWRGKATGQLENHEHRITKIESVCEMRHGEEP